MIALLLAEPLTIIVMRLAKSPGGNGMCICIEHEPKATLVLTQRLCGIDFLNFFVEKFELESSFELTHKMDQDDKKPGILKKIWNFVVGVFCVLFVIKAILNILGIGPD